MIYLKGLVVNGQNILLENTLCNKFESQCVLTCTPICCSQGDTRLCALCYCLKSVVKTQKCNNSNRHRCSSQIYTLTPCPFLYISSLEDITLLLIFSSLSMISYGCSQLPKLLGTHSIIAWIQGPNFCLCFYRLSRFALNQLWLHLSRHYFWVFRPENGSVGSPSWVTAQINKWKGRFVCLGVCVLFFVHQHIQVLFVSEIYSRQTVCLF